jgi:tetratricopeptide (TPR) repeat protein
MSALRSRLIEVVLVAIVATPALSAQLSAPAAKLLDSARLEIDRAAIRGDLDRIIRARGLVDRVLAAHPNDPWALHYAGFGLYREATIRRGRDTVDVNPFYERALDFLDRSEKVKPIAETAALRASALGQLIGTNPLKGMINGPRSQSAMDQAIKLAPNNPRVWLVRGISAIYTPEMFGGGLEKAEEYLKKALTNFERDTPASPAPTWGKHEPFVWLGQVYEKQGKRDAARAMYEKALTMEPEDGWVRMVLLPKVAKGTMGASR